MSLVDAIPQTIKEIGRINARGRAAGGQYGQALSDIGQMVSTIPAQIENKKILDANAQIRQQQLQSGSLDLAAKRRQAAADEALGNAFSTSLNPDGTINISALTQHLSTTPAASSIPKIVESLNAMQKSSIDLQESSARLGISKEDLQGKEADEMGALAHAAESAGDDPSDQAGIILSGVASRVKKGLMTQEDANPIIAGMLGDVEGEGPTQPDPDKVKATIAKFKAASKEQRTLADTDSRAKYQAESAKALADSRQQATDQKTLQAQLTNIASQLSRTTSKEQYARVYQGIPENVKTYFDSPEEWTKDSPARASEVLLTPEQREMKRSRMEADHDRDVAELDRQAAAAETARHNKASEATADKRANRPAGNGPADQTGVYGTATKRGYDAFVENWKERYPKPSDKEKYDDNGDVIPQAKQPAPPSLEKWYVMTPPERQRVLMEPSARIDDAEMQRRIGGAAPTPNPAGGTPTPVPAKPAPQQAAKPGAGKMITAAKLKDLAKQFKMSEEDARAKAIAEGYAVVK